MKLSHAIIMTLMAGVMTLASCGGQKAPSANAVARDAIKSVINPTIAQQFPGVPSDIIAECIVDSASNSEIVQIANAALLGTPTDSLYAILPIARRPETLKCVTYRALGGQ